MNLYKIEYDNDGYIEYADIVNIDDAMSISEATPEIVSLFGYRVLRRLVYIDIDANIKDTVYNSIRIELLGYLRVNNINSLLE